MGAKRWTVGLVAAVALGGLVNSPPAQAADPLKMVALGDSQAAGPLVTTQSSWDCLRSTDNWPSVAARELGASLTDVSCSGATTADLTGRRFGYMAPQLDAVTSDVDVVTMTMGANDLNLGSVVPSCMNPFPEPVGVSCKLWQPDNYTARIETVGANLAAALRQIHQKAPHARVHLVSYFHYWGTAGCYPIDPIWRVDAAWLQSIFDRLNAELASVAAQGGATYVDLAGPSRDHGVCSAQSQKWVEGLIPTSQAAPYHPNAAGNQNAGRIVADAIG